MRLSMEEVQKMKNWFTNYVSELSELGKKVRDIFSIEEAQNLFDTIEALQKQNELLRAHVARMREALDELTSELDYAHLLENGIEWDKHKSKTFDGALELLKNIPADYHNPADVEALRTARNAIQYVLYHLKLGNKTWIIDRLEPVLDKIDKVLGGKEGAE